MAIDIYTTLEELQQGLKLESNRRYRIVLRPKVVAARFSGMLFETNKSFLLPAAIPHIKKNLPRIIQTRSDNKLLIVGHTDTSGDTAYNDELSLERASAVQAFLKDDVDGWLCFYETSVPAKKRWGDAEDRLMLGSVPAGRTEEPDPVGDFQLSRGLQVDNIIGPVTRRQLITEYMNQDEVTLPATMEVSKHGCGEHFPLDETGTELDADVRDDEHDSLDRRVELFFFQGSIDPPARPEFASGQPRIPSLAPGSQARRRSDAWSAAGTSGQVHLRRRGCGVGKVRTQGGWSSLSPDVTLSSST